MLENIHIHTKMTQLELVYATVMKKYRKLTTIWGENWPSSWKKWLPSWFLNIHLFGFETFWCQLSRLCCNYKLIIQIHLWKRYLFTLMNLMTLKMTLKYEIDIDTHPHLFLILRMIYATWTSAINKRFRKNFQVIFSKSRLAIDVLYEYFR